jgi:hypothetical protein
MPDGRVVAVLGDVVGSREHRNRGAMRARLDDALSHANEHVAALQPLTPTIGDEFQGLYGDLPPALRATMLAALAAKPDVDLRFGVGLGSVEFPAADAGPYRQDGPAWWAAREAIGVAAEIPRSRQAPAGCRTFLVSHEQASGDYGVRIDQLVNAYLLCRDEILHRMDLVDARLLLGQLSGERQSVMARREDVTQSAVSQRSRRKGHYALLAAQQLLEGTARW